MHFGIAAVAHFQPRKSGRLWLDGDDASIDGPEGTNTVADVAANVEHQIARRDELPVERDHALAACRTAIIDP